MSTALIKHFYVCSVKEKVDVYNIEIALKII